MGIPNLTGYWIVRTLSLKHTAIKQADLNDLNHIIDIAYIEQKDRFFTCTFINQLNLDHVDDVTLPSIPAQRLPRLGVIDENGKKVYIADDDDSGIRLLKITEIKCNKVLRMTGVYLEGGNDANNNRQSTTVSTLDMKRIPKCEAEWLSHELDKIRSQSNQVESPLVSFP